MTSQTQQHTPAYIIGPRIVMLLSVLALMLIGIVMIYSASSVTAITEASSLEEANPLGDVLSQVMYACVGILLALGLWQLFPYRLWRTKILAGLWIVCIVLLILTMAMGTEALGAQRWLSLGSFGLQPSEFAKVCFILTGACIMADAREGKYSVVRALLYGLGFVLLPLCFLFISQSDFGTTFICLVGLLSVLWLGELPTRIFVAILVIILLFAFLAVFTAGYRSSRLTVYMNPWNDGEGGQGTGYQIIHSFYAFSEGGLFGVGLGNSREKFSYLPEAETDFVFSIIGEELGMLGALLVIALFMAFLWAGMKIALHAPDNFGTMIAGGLTTMIVFQAFLNICCAIGVFPTTGKPLPFISSGGSSLVATLIMVGIILSVSKASSEPSIYERRRANLRVVHGERSFDGGSYDGGLRGQARTELPQTGSQRNRRVG